MLFDWSLKENSQRVLSFVVSFIILLLLSSLSYIVYNLKNRYRPALWTDNICIHLPFWLWHGFTAFMTLVNAFYRIYGHTQGQVLRGATAGSFACDLQLHRVTDLGRFSGWLCRGG
ncbi:uncharacterized protein BYT42DRAFT_541870 [Radiomyces spectabilis]|uniref:uncharacterized protein n=1 Tax=Radiomyces spectabilis TaxID=64574 RepID=UPI00221EFFDE|nr:uncharacterized protein BYT42DRAFT_541870 [Radiomyces spectabilis]KAI8393640.1 hypothetical protein BYT42DRAFT_541870 [Radiomyces spectabilis]